MGSEYLTLVGTLIILTRTCVGGNNGDKVGVRMC